MKSANIRDCMNVGKQTKPYHGPLANARMRNWFFRDNTIMDPLYILGYRIVC
jgi:hypothetical protein